MGAFGYGGFKGAQRGETPRFLDAEIAQTNAENQAQMQENQAKSGNLMGAASLGMEGYKAGMFGGAPSTAGTTATTTGASPTAAALMSAPANVAANQAAGQAVSTLGLEAGTGALVNEGAMQALGSMAPEALTTAAAPVAGSSGALASVMASPLAPFAAALLASQLF
jgi:hypothetical protein